jgi:hypothetical protein
VLTSFSISAGLLLGLFFDPEDEGNVFIRNVALPRNYTVLQQKNLL